MEDEEVQLIYHEHKRRVDLEQEFESLRPSSNPAWNIFGLVLVFIIPFILLGYSDVEASGSVVYALFCPLISALAVNVVQTEKRINKRIDVLHKLLTYKVS